MCLSPGDEGLDLRTRRDRIHPNDCGLWMVRCKGKSLRERALRRPMLRSKPRYRVIDHANGAVFTLVQ
jgi:hypothetical protein